MDASKLNFMTGGAKHKNAGSQDLGLSLHKKNTICFIFRNGVHEQILKIGEHGIAKFIIIAFVDGRLYFKGTTDKEGFLVTTNPNCNNRYCKIRAEYVTEEFRDWVIEHEGNFDLRFDSEAGLYYISNEMQFMKRG